MTIAVLLPSYKPGDYLLRCIGSIESQTLSKSKYKVYLALNGPRDGYEEFILDALGKCTFSYEYLYLAEPGVSNARNAMLDSLSEDYVAFVDDDDVLSDNYLEQLFNHVSAGCMAISNVYSFANSIDILTENYIGKSFSSLNKNEVSFFKARKFFSSPWAKLIPKKAIGSIRFDPKLRVGEDSLFMARISKQLNGVTKTDASACYYVCQRDGSASRKKNEPLEEINRVCYLVTTYSSMLFKGYDSLFILSRIAASLLHLRRIF